IGLTVINLFLLVFLLAQIRRADAQGVAPVLRGRALQIVDTQDRIRAELLVYEAETVNSKKYPDTVLFRMADPKGGPVVKLSASEKGSALGLSDDVNGRVELHANRDKGNFLKVVSREGREQLIKP
ncbi:MAG TPA: hypothetical protein VJ023_08380, partial [Pyrinomonadaceae bacterium]|nr:hypothetical protein [Pyrinomonadaceae bacterium]